MLGRELSTEAGQFQAHATVGHQHASRATARAAHRAPRVARAGRRARPGRRGRQARSRTRCSAARRASGGGPWSVCRPHRRARGAAVPATQLLAFLAGRTLTLSGCRGRPPPVAPSDPALRADARLVGHLGDVAIARAKSQIASDPRLRQTQRVSSVAGEQLLPSGCWQ